MKEIIKNCPVIAILRDTEDEAFEFLMDCLYEGGIRAIEISLSGKNALKQLNWAKKNMPADIHLGAGTVLTLEQVKKTIETGAEYLLSPSTEETILSYCSEHSIKFLPGVFSPTDISKALSYGYNVLKLFPVHCLPDNYIKSLKGPFPQVEFAAVGGVTTENAKIYLKQGFLGVGIGNSLVNKRLLEDKNWKMIKQEIKIFVDNIMKYSN